MSDKPEIRPVSPESTGTAPAAPSKRRWFKRGVFGIAAVGIAGLMAAHHARHALGAADHGGHRHHGWRNKSPEELAQRLQKGVDKALDHLDATPAQRERIKPIIDTAFKDLMPLRDLRRTLREDALKILTAQSVDRSALESLRARQIEQIDAASKRLTGALADVATELNPVQRAQLAQWAAHGARHWKS